MNSKQKLHQIKLAHWTKLFHEQASSGLTVKAGVRSKTFPFTSTITGNTY